MANYNINAVTRRVVYTGSAGVGPYAFSFEVLTQTDVDVYFNTTLLTLTTDYTVTINANGTGSITIVTGTNVPTTPDADDQITIVGSRDIERTTDFVTSGDFRAAAINEQLDALTIFDQQLLESSGRAISAPITDPTSVDMTLPAKDDRKGKYLAFNATTGNPEVSASIDDITTLGAITDDIATLADIEDGTDATDAIQTVAGISGNVTTVAGISSNVTTVAGISSDVTTVAADGTDIGTVAGISSDVTSVAGVSANVTTVAGISSNVTTVAGVSSDVTTVANVASDVTTVAGISGDVTSVAAQVVGYAFSTTTTMADPGSGNVRFNNATVASVTAIAIDDLDGNGVDQSAYIALWDDSTNTIKGTLVFRTGGGDVATFNITGLTDNTGWFEVAVTHVASSGTFSNAEIPISASPAQVIRALMVLGQVMCPAPVLRLLITQSCVGTRPVVSLCRTARSLSAMSARLPPGLLRLLLILQLRMVAQARLMQRPPVQTLVWLLALTCRRMTPTPRRPTPLRLSRSASVALSRRTTISALTRTPQTTSSVPLPAPVR